MMRNTKKKQLLLTIHRPSWTYSHHVTPKMRRDEIKSSHGGGKGEQKFGLHGQLEHAFAKREER